MSTTPRTDALDGVPMTRKDSDAFARTLERELGELQNSLSLAARIITAKDRELSQATTEKIAYLRTIAEFVEVTEQALQETVDASVYPDSPCIEKSTRDIMRAVVAKAKGTS